MSEPKREKIEVTIGEPTSIGGQPVQPAEGGDGYTHLQDAIVKRTLPPVERKPPTRRRPGMLTRVLGAIAVGLDRGTEIERPKLLPTPAPIEHNERAQKWDERYMGPELEVEQSRAGMDYVIIKGEMIALKANVGQAVSFDDEKDGEEVVLTEYGPRTLDRSYDFNNEPPCQFEMVWKDPADGRTRKYTELPKNHIQHQGYVTFIRDGQKVSAPLFQRGWQKD